MSHALDLLPTFLVIGTNKAGALRPCALSHVRKALRRPFLEPFPYPPMDPRTEADLRWRYRPEVRKLEAMLGRDLSHWYPDGAGVTPGPPRC